MIGFYSIEHILLIIVLLLSIFDGLYVIRKFELNEKQTHKVLVILGILLLIFWILTRLSHIYHSIDEKAVGIVFGETRPYNWFMVLPDSFCSTIGLIVPFIIFFKKYENSKVMESICCMALLGLLTNIFYPEYMGRLPFYQFRTIGAIIYHTICGFLFLLLLSNKMLRPKVKNWYYTAIAISLMISLGVIELVHLNFCEAFNITKPLVAGLSITSVGFLSLGYIVIDLLFRFTIEKIQK